jgi:type I restriction enzyme M protein
MANGTENKPGTAKTPSSGIGGNLGFEAELFKAADKLRGNMEPSDYKHVALGLIFLKHISDSFGFLSLALIEHDHFSRWRFGVWRSSFVMA